MEITPSGVEKEGVLEMGFERWVERQRRRGREENV